MTGEYAISVYLVLGIGTALAIGSLFAPLTSLGGFVNSSEEHERTVQQEYSYCASSLSDVDCRCFAGKAGHILSHEGSGIGGWDRANRSALARGQATAAC